MRWMPRWWTSCIPGGSERRKPRILRYHRAAPSATGRVRGPGERRKAVRPTTTNNNNSSSSHGDNMSKSQSLQDPFLNALRRERVPVSIYLVNGIKLQGTIESFDQFVVLLRNTVSQMVYKHAISTVVPARNVRLAPAGAGADAEEPAEAAAE